MKAASAQLLAFLNAARGGDVAIAMADCYTITLAAGWVGRFTSWDQPITWNGNVFAAGSVLIQGMKLKLATGLEVDRQQITIAAPPGATISGSPWMNAIRAGALDGATIQRDRVFMDPSLAGGIDGVTLFRGRVSTVDQVGRTSAKITVASPLIVLDYDMPRNIFSPTCLHALYDSGCTLNMANFALNSVVGAGSTVVTIMGGGASANHVQGSLVLQSGLNSGIRATVRSVAAGVSWTLMYPLPDPPSTGDAFSVFLGCDHTFGTCGAKFNNQANFRGFPNVPPPVYAL